jgi:Ca-activated chloride channel family protein
LTLLLAGGLALSGCSDKGEDSGTSGETDADADADADSDTDADADADTDVEPGDSGMPVEPDCDEDLPPTLYLSPDDSNSTASPVLARLALLNGTFDYSTVPVRPWEFMNYATFDYPPAAEGEVALHAALVPAPEVGPDTWALQVGVAAPQRTSESRANINLTFVVDTSGSMSGESIAQVKEAGEAVAASLKAGDIVSMVTWSSSAAAVLEGHVVTRPNDPDVLTAFASLSSGGGTDLSGGLLTGFHVASEHASPELINRLVLISDGGANMGVTDADVIGTYVGSRDEDGIYLAGIGVGSQSTYNPRLMDDVTDAGRGASLFLGETSEAWTGLAGDGFLRTFDVAARDVRLELDLPVGFELVRFSGEEYSTDPDEIEPQHLAPNDSMVFLQYLQTGCPEAVDSETPLTARVTWTDPGTFEAHTTTLSTTFGALLEADPTLLRKGQAVQDTADALKLWQDPSVGTTVKAEAVTTAAGRVDAALVLDPDDLDLAGLRVMLDAL